MKDNIKYKLYAIIIVYSLISYSYQEDPALKVNLNPPEEDTKDVMSKKFL